MTAALFRNHFCRLVKFVEKPNLLQVSRNRMLHNKGGIYGIVVDIRHGDSCCQLFGSLPTSTDDHSSRNLKKIPTFNLSKLSMSSYNRKLCFIKKQVDEAGMLTSRHDDYITLLIFPKRRFRQGRPKVNRYKILVR